jgi:cellulose synthase/poly-beta-1,6-N-acetylglucosamine synthase-like glycosyltransferase
LALLEFLAWAGMGLVVYSYALYPLVLSVVAAGVQLVRDARYVLAKRDRRGQASGRLPAVAVVISAFNEDKHLADRIANLLALDYPSHLLKCYIGSDGSRDRTGDILAACTDPRIQGHVFAVNRGKANVLNDLVSKVREPIIVFSDANTFFHEQALKRLVRHFEDPLVGGVSGELRLLGSAGDNQDSLYWRLEQFLKFFEARIHGLLGANGAIYGIRRSLWKPLLPDTICDDFCVAMNVSAAGAQLVYEPTAWAEEETPDLISDEYHRRIRIGIGNFQAFFRHPEYLWRTSWGTRFSYVSHKVLRWFAPHLLIVSFGACLALSWESEAWAWWTALQAIGYAGAALLYRQSMRGGSLPSALKIPVFLFALNWAFLVASWRHATGQYSGSWRRTSR